MLAVSDGGSQKGAAVPPHHPALVQDQNFPPPPSLPVPAQLFPPSLALTLTLSPGAPGWSALPFPSHPVPCWRTWMVSTPDAPV